MTAQITLHADRAEGTDIIVRESHIIDDLAVLDVKVDNVDVTVYLSIPQLVRLRNEAGRFLNNYYASCSLCEAGIAETHQHQTDRGL
jgi:hypothetical protein